MAIQYPGGTIVSTTFTGATKNNIVTNLQTQLNNAGWTTISGGGTGDVILESASTPTAANNIRVRLRDSAATNCTVVNMQNAAGTKVSANFFLLPAAAKTFRVLANKYMFAVFTPGSTAAREYLMCGTLYIPSDFHGVITGELGFCNGNACTDTDTNVRSSFRTVLSGSRHTSDGQAWSCLVNGNLSEFVSTSASNQSAGGLRLVTASSAMVTASTTGYRWHDDTLQQLDPLVAWGLTAGTDEAKIRGQLWGCMILSDSYAGDTTLSSVDSHNWWAITNTNTGDANYMRGTLFMITS